MSPSIEIIFAYTNDALVLAALKEFHVFPVDPNTHARLALTPVIVNKSLIPTITAPLFVQMTGYAKQMVEVMPVDLDGKEGITFYAPVYLPLPPVTSVAQVTA